jgi:hypothetical protein
MRQPGPPFSLFRFGWVLPVIAGNSLHLARATNPLLTGKAREGSYPCSSGGCQHARHLKGIDMEKERVGKHNERRAY